MFIKVCVAFVFGLQTLKLIDFTEIYLLKGMKPKNKGHTNFYECCDLPEKVYLNRHLYRNNILFCEEAMYYTFMFSRKNHNLD